MKNFKHKRPDKVYSDIMNNQNARRIFLKVIIGFGIIVFLFFIAVKITNKKLSELSETISAIMEPDIKLIKLKELSGSLYSAEANVKAYTIRRDTGYLFNYEYDIKRIRIRLDTLSRLSNEGKFSSKNRVKDDKNFSAQIDTLKELIIARIDLFDEYIVIKTGESSQDVLFEIVRKIKTENPVVKNKSVQKADTLKPSFLSRIFSSEKHKSILTSSFINPGSKDSIQRNILKIIAQTQSEENRKENGLLFKETNIAQREYLIMNRILSVLNRMEEKELAEGIKRIHSATDETSGKISFIRNRLILFGLLLAFAFSLSVYFDIIQTKRFKDRLLKVKRDAEKSASHYSLSLIEASLDPLVTISSEGKITDMNQATVNITGLTRENLKGTDFFDYFTEPQKAREVYQQVFAKGSVADSPLTLQRNDGKLTDVLFDGSVYKDDNGIVLGVVVVARDITNQKIFENELIEAKSKAESETQKAEKSNKLKEAFLANMSHEIRTPLNAIMGFSDLLSRSELEEKQKKFAIIIKSAGENLLTIINDILDISKIESGMMTFEKNNFRIKDTFQSLKELLNGKAKAKNLELFFDCDEDVPEVLTGDQTRLSQIIINLAGNAIKFTAGGSVKVRAKVFKIEKETAIVEFSVTDTGIGIQADQLEHIFERFRQAESHTTRLYGGTGLGLSIAKQLTELQGGTLSVESEINAGSVFYFRIPYEKSTKIHPAVKLTENKFNIEELHKLNILLAEDNRLNVMLISSLFSENNLNLQVAENGKVCLEKLKENNFDIILLDMEMPVMNGYDTTLFIRKELKNNIPIIAMTAHAMSGEREKCLSLGMNDYISKPINAELLFKKIYDLTHNS